MKEKLSLELKVGVFVFIGLAIMVTFVLFIGDFRDWRNRYNIKIEFGFINGVRVGAPVRFSGLDVGEVKDIQPLVDPATNATRIRIIARLKGGVRIPEDSRVWVNTLGLLGEKYIEIMPGKDYSRVLKDEDIIAGNDPVPMNEFSDYAIDIIQDLKDLINKINNAQGTIARLLYEDTIYNDLEAFVADIKKHPWKLFFRTKEKPEDKEKKPAQTNISPGNK